MEDTISNTIGRQTSLFPVEKYSMSMPVAHLHFSHQLRLEYLSSYRLFYTCFIPTSLSRVWKYWDLEIASEGSPIEIPHVSWKTGYTDTDKRYQISGKMLQPFKRFKHSINIKIGIRSGNQQIRSERKQIPSSQTEN